MNRPSFCLDLILFAEDAAVRRQRHYLPVHLRPVGAAGEVVERDAEEIREGDQDGQGRRNLTHLVFAKRSVYHTKSCGDLQLCQPSFVPQLFQSRWKIQKNTPYRLTGTISPVGIFPVTC